MSTMYRRPSSNAVAMATPAHYRKSVLPAPSTGGNMRRSISMANIPRPSTISRGPRSSSVSRMPGQNRLSMYQFPGGKPQTHKDTRPISDKGYQTQMIHKMLDFLHRQQYGGTPITEKQLRDPKREDFINIFTFLYGYVDENYEYKKERPLEQEIPELLKMLGYNYLSSSVMKSFNARHSWPHVLAALHWLREFVEIGLNFVFETAVFPNMDHNFSMDGQSEGGLALGLYQYYFQCFLRERVQEGMESYEEFDQYLDDALGFENAHAHLENAAAENERLETEFRELSSKLDEPNNIQSIIKAKMADIGKMDDHINDWNDYIRKSEEISKNEKEQKKAHDEEIKKLKVEIETKKDIINKQGIKPADVQRLTDRMHDLMKRISKCKAEKEQLDKERWAFERSVAQIRDTLESKANEFSKKAKALIRAFPALRDQKIDLELSPFYPGFLESVEKYIKPWITNVKTIVLRELQSVRTDIDSEERMISDLQMELEKLESETIESEKLTKKRDNELRNLEDKMRKEIQELNEQKDALEKQLEKTTEQNNMTVAAMDKQLADMVKKHHEKAKQYKAAEDGMESDVRRAMEMASQFFANVNNIKAEAVERIQAVKKEVAKRSGKS